MMFYFFIGYKGLHNDNAVKIFEIMTDSVVCVIFIGYFLHELDIKGIKEKVVNKVLSKKDNIVSSIPEAEAETNTVPASEGYEDPVYKD
jgi:hypothetical protein